MQPTLVQSTAAQANVVEAGLVLLFGAVIVALEVYIMVRRDKGWGASNKQIVGLTIVIIAGLFLISGGYGQTETGPMFGLLGAIAGYLFGAGADKTGS